MKRIILALAALTVASLSAFSQSDGESFRWEYGADFSYTFDNREFDKGHNAYTPSCTLNGTNIMPEFGFSINTDGKVYHRMMLGVNILHEMGRKEKQYSWVSYYDAHVKLGKGMFEGVAGVLPRSFLEGDYGKAFFSDSLNFYDRTIEGALLKYGSENFFTELSLDWMGMKGSDVKERFQILSYGNWQICSLLDLGWSGRFYHYAGSIAAPGVVDNHLLNPFVRLKLGRLVGADRLTIKAGPMLTYQRDRVREKAMRSPIGGEFILDAKHHAIGYHNTLYLGQDIMPYYSWTDTAGNPYGHDLYQASPFYRGFYNRAELYWEPRLTDFIKMRLGASFHFTGSGYQGCQQRFSLIFNLDPFRNKRIVTGKIYPENAITI